MTETTGDLWDLSADWRCITTNGTVKRDGTCVMGRGCAAEAKARFPGLDKALGHHIKLVGNVVGIFDLWRLITFPVKYEWHQQASLTLIKESAMELAEFAGDYPENTILLPRPGCGNGRLRWEDVAPILREILPDNVTVVSK